MVRQYTGHSVAGMHAMLSGYHIIRRQEILEAARRNKERRLGEREAAAQLAARATATAIVQ